MSKTINVRFGSNGFYHAAYGRMGRGKHTGKVYALPEEFGARETVEVEIRDPKNTNVVTGTKKFERFKHLPKNAEVLTADDMEAIEAEARQRGEEVPRPIYPKVLEPEQLDGIVGVDQGVGQSRRAVHTAQTRTTGIPSPTRPRRTLNRT